MKTHLVKKKEKRKNTITKEIMKKREKEKNLKNLT